MKFKKTIVRAAWLGHTQMRKSEAPAESWLLKKRKNSVREAVIPKIASNLEKLGSMY